MGIIKRFAAALLVLSLAFMPLSLFGRAEAEISDAEASSGSTTFTFTNSGITASNEDENSFTIDGTALKITAGGTYILKGSCSDGKVTVKKGTTGVTLVLNGLDLTSAETAPIICNKGTEVNISAGSGTVNRLADTALNNSDLHPENTKAENAVIKAKDGCRLTLSGSGTLNIVSNGKNGIKGGVDLAADGDTPASSASVTIKQLTLNVTANVNDAIKSEQLLSILSGRITIAATDDAIKCDRTLNIGQSGSGPAITISSSVEGIGGAIVNISGGNITVNSSNDGISCSNTQLGNYAFACNISGGTVSVNSTDGDGIDSNGTLSITGGNVTVISSANDTDSPLDSERGITLGGGTLFAMGSAGMIENPATAHQVYVTFGRMEGGSSLVSIPAGSTVKLTNASGGTLFTTTAPRNAGYIIFSSPSLSNGTTVKLLVNGTEIAAATASYDAGSNPGVPGTPVPTAVPNTEVPTAPVNTAAPTAAASTPAPTANAATPAPSASGETAFPSETVSPGSSVDPDYTDDPAATQSPDGTGLPDESELPLSTDAPISPDISIEPGETGSPAGTGEPEASDATEKKLSGGRLALILGGAAVLAGAGVTIGIIASKKKKILTSERKGN